MVKIFDEAKEFKVAGDWYIYTRVLENGDIVYSAKSLNKYRKHDKGSASTIVKLSLEYREVTAIQNRVAKKYKLSESNLRWQEVRRKGMGMIENKKNIDKRGRIAWFTSDFNEGSGGHRTIFQNINALIKRGYACDLYVKPYNPELPVGIYERLVKNYGEFNGDVFNDYTLARDYDAVIATAWDTAEPVAKTNCDNKLYFIQDYEPWFFPMSQEYLGAKESYSYGLKGVSIGNWLPVKLKEEYGLKVASFSFGADLKVYKKDNRVKKENALCFIFQPGKPRRCTNLGLKALRIVQTVRPDIKIYLFGSDKLEPKNKNIVHLGVLSTKKCNELYNKCKVGLCFSASNPSRIPFEMMAAGLPVVDLYLENNLYDFPEDGCLLAKPDPEAVAAAILKIFEDDELREKMSSASEKYMKEYDLNRGFEEFGEIIDATVAGKEVETRLAGRTYNSKPVLPMKCDFRLGPEIEFKTEDEIWRENLTIPQRVYLKIRYILFGR